MGGCGCSLRFYDFIFAVAVDFRNTVLCDFLRIVCLLNSQRVHDAVIAGSKPGMRTLSPAALQPSSDVLDSRPFPVLRLPGRVDRQEQLFFCLFYTWRTR
jgi:hypothetical protein